jgi:hypothetical protein
VSLSLLVIGGGTVLLVVALAGLLIQLLGQRDRDDRPRDSGG